jgi:uncharacterized protein
MTTTSARTVPVRAPAPDLARGLALAAIAMANVMIYLHARPYGVRGHIVEDGSLDRATTLLLTTVVDGRAYPLFAALYGYGLARIAATRLGAGWSDAETTSYLRRRSLLLILLGAGHALLAFSGDILGTYGLLGLLLAGTRSVADRTLVRTAVIALPLAALVVGWIFAAAPTEPTMQRELFWSYAIADPTEAAAFRMLEWLMTPVGMLGVVPAMLIGVVAGRHRVLEQLIGRRRMLGRVAAVGIGVGWLGGLPMGLATAHVWQPDSTALVLASVLHVGSGILCGIGYAAAVGWFVARSPRAAEGTVAGALRATGARSLSAYLAQSAVFALLLPAATLAVGAVLGTAAAALLALAVWLLTVLGCALLERAGRAGPAERLMRRALHRPSERVTMSA